jgi:hypothetical protein
MNILSILKRYKLNKDSNYFKNYCLKNFKFTKIKKIKTKKKIVLCEFTNMQPNIFPAAHLINLLANKNKADIFAYQIFNLNFLKKLEWLISDFLDLREFSIYRSFNISKFIRFKFSVIIILFSIKAYLKCISKIKNKKDLEDFRFQGIQLGDLIYDGFLKKYKKITIDIKSLKFKIYFFLFISNYFWFLKITKKFDVKAILVSHTVYELAIPIRIAIKNSIPVYQCDIHYIRCFNKNYFRIDEFNNYKKNFKKNKKKISHRYFNLAKKRLLNRVFKYKNDLEYSTKKSDKIYNKNFILKNNKPNILVASHCFSDSPHSYGNHFFTDFYEWFLFLSNIAKRTDYNWYIKVHPDFKKISQNFVKNFVVENKKFQLLPSNISHKLIVKQGINFCLTVYGTVGEEYPFYGVPVINATKNNPHINYNFNINPTNLKEYEKILLNLNNIKLNFKREEVYECYFMKNFFYKNYLFVDDILSLIKKFNGYKNIFNDSLYTYLIKNKLNKDHNSVMKKLDKFINSKKLILSIID